jgi:glycerol-3-phosphate acyltransferase PlsY
MMGFPTIQTDFWDGVIAVPLVVIITQLFKVFPIPRQYFPTIASVIGYIISIFFSHRHDLWAGIFMGAFYGAAAVGTYSSLKTSWLAFRRPIEKKKSYR